MNIHRDLEGFLDWAEHALGLTLIVSDFYGCLLAEADISMAIKDHLFHLNPYCMCVKGDRRRHMRCIQAKTVLREALERLGGKTAQGLCPFGVFEVSRPIISFGRVIGAVSVTGYKGDARGAQPLLRRAEQRYGLILREATDIYEQYLAKRTDQSEPAEHAAGLLAATLSAVAEARRLRPPQGEEKKTRELVSRAMEFIYSQAACEIRVSDVAAFCGVSASHLAHLFKRDRGQTVVQTINEARLERARAILRHSALPVTRIAELAGFADANYFSARFSRRYGLSPTQYRAKEGVR